MGIKATLKEDHIPKNKFTLIVLGMPAIFFTKISGIEFQTDVVDLPDRTRASGGNPQATEFTAETPLHHSTEQAAMELWLLEGQDPVSPLYKKAGTLVMMSGTGLVLKTYTLTGVWVSRRKLPDLDFEDEGGMATCEWTFQCDSVLPI